MKNTFLVYLIFGIAAVIGWGNDSSARDVSIGPKVSLGFHPAPAQFGIEGKLKGLFGAGVDYGYFPDMTIDSISVGYRSISGTFRIFPTQGALFFGAAIGSQTFRASKTEDLGLISARAEVEVRTLFLAPHIGWRWTWQSGLFWGLELGWQIALNSTTSVAAPSGTPVSLINDVTEKGDQLGKASLPRIGLLQLGWMF